MEKEKKLEILRLLQENARRSPAMIASMLGVEEAVVLQVMDEFERDRVIVRYSAMVNWDKVDERRVTAVIDVKVTPQRDVGFDAIAQRIYRFPEVSSVFLMSGAYDLQVVVVGNHIREVAQFVSEKLSTLEHVNSTTTHFLLKRYKWDGVIFDDGEQDQRLVITP
ncbi:Lrp/AsnC family transcriptional regulator [Alicyclobacillaceae bacterium I2511]|nr:Lrp/AsnC family transcriptional regulator [Alicyclobacillaceae bacterium I2511]